MVLGKDGTSCTIGIKSVSAYSYQNISMLHPNATLKWKFLQLNSDWLEIVEGVRLSSTAMIWSKAQPQNMIVIYGNALRFRVTGDAAHSTIQKP